MVYRAVVTLEKPNSTAVPPRTVRLAITAGGAGTAASRAIRQAIKQAKPAHWDSLVVVLEKAERC